MFCTTYALVEVDETLMSNVYEAFDGTVYCQEPASVNLIVPFVPKPTVLGLKMTDEDCAVPPTQKVPINAPLVFAVGD